jgi:hypothetical protein
MKNFYGGQYLLIGLSVISFSLSGMEKEKAMLRVGDSQLVQLQEPTHIITFQPCGGYFEVTQENQDQFKQYFKDHGITLNNPLTKVIAVKEAQQTNKNNTLSASSKGYNKTTFELLPLDLFVREKGLTSLTINKENQVLQLKACGAKPEIFFKAHTELLTEQVQNTKSTSKKENPAQYAQDLQTQLNANKIPTLKFLAQLLRPKQILSADTINAFINELGKKSYEQQLAMINEVDEKQHQEILTLFLANKNLGEMLANKYNTLKKSVNLGDQSETDSELGAAVATLCDRSLTLKNAFCVYSILTQESLTSPIAIDLLPSSIKTIINSCRTFKKVIEYREEEQRLEEEQNSISITKEVAHLSSVIESMMTDFADDEQKQGNIKYRVPSCIQKDIMEKLCELLDRCLFINCDGLDEETITAATKTLNGDIAKLDLNTVTQLLCAAHYLDIVKQAPNDKNVIKPIILKPSLLSTFTNKLISEPYDKRNTIISVLDQDLANDCLRTIENLCIKLQDDLTRKYNFKKQTGCIQNHPPVIRQVKVLDPILPKAIAWKEDDRIHTNHSLSQILFINDILQNKKVSKDLITDDSVGTPVKMILDGCNYFDEEIKKAEEGKRLRDEHARQLEAEKAEAARIKKEQDEAQERWNKTIQGRIHNNIARFIAYTKQNPFNVIFPTYVAFVAGYCYYFRDRIATGLANDYTRLTDFLKRFY